MSTNKNKRQKSLEDELPSINLQKGDNLYLKRYNKQDNYWRIELNGMKLKAKVYIDIQPDKGTSHNNSPRSLSISSINSLKESSVSIRDSTQFEKPISMSTVADLFKMVTSPFLNVESPKKSKKNLLILLLLQRAPKNS